MKLRVLQRQDKEIVAIKDESKFSVVYELDESVQVWHRTDYEGR